MQAPGIMGFSFEIMDPQYFRALWIAIGEEKFLQEVSLLALCLDLDLHRYLHFPRSKPRFSIANACKEASWLQIVAKDMDIEDIMPTTIFCDNQASISMAIKTNHQHALEAHCNSLPLLLREG